MIRQPVSSRQLSAVGYDPATQTLEIEFKPAQRTGDSAVWQYVGVAPETHAEFISAESLGRFFGGTIKGQYPEKKVEIVHQDGTSTFITEEF